MQSQKSSMQGGQINVAVTGSRRRRAQFRRGQLGAILDDRSTLFHQDLMHRNLSVASDRTMRMPLFAAHVELFDAGT